MILEEEERRGGGGRRRPQEPPTRGPSSWNVLVARSWLWRRTRLWPSWPGGTRSEKDFDFSGSIINEGKPPKPQTRSPRGVLHEGQGSCHRNFNNSCMSLQLRIRFKDGIAGSLGLGFRVRMNAKTLEECSWGWKFRNPPAQAERLFLHVVVCPSEVGLPSASACC